MREVTVITGGAGGMGFATANVFGHQGQTIFLCDIKEEALKASAKILERQNMEVQYAVLDVSDEAQVKEAAARAAELGKIKNVINTAGLSPILVADMGEEAGAEAIMKVNAMGTIHMVEAFYPLLSSGTSMVLFTSSAVYNMPVAPEPIQQVLTSAATDREHIFEKLMTLAAGTGRAYMFSKMFVREYVKMNAGRFGHKGCRLNSIAPGRIVTPMHRTLIEKEPERIAGEMAEMPFGRYGNAYEIANLIDFLCSWRASYIHGIDILMDEGTEAFVRVPQIPD